ncbi:VWA domain-containing protein [Frankia sp. AgW1.1]|uniref:VWA domain-containing protein n=1 Tax=Frankia sp. AgW1.1 TaxID=1836971 RepID=UPI0019343DB5|nr:VWA domain-containing protein [Frankia sp. AgW1.1]
MPKSPDPADRSKAPAAIVILADEATGLSPAQIDAEKQAVRDAVAYEPNPGSSIIVLGFGSATPTGEPAVDVVCSASGGFGPIGSAGSGARSDLSRCADAIRARPAAPDSTSDPVDALDVARQLLLKAPPSRPRILFLLSGSVGALALVHPDPGEPHDTATERLNRSRDLLISRVPNQLKAAGIEVWPIGFGAADTPVLHDLATNAAARPGSCPSTEQSGRQPPPVYLAGGDDEIVPAMISAFGAARCTSPLDGSAGDPTPNGGSGGGGVSTPTFILAVSLLAAAIVGLAAAWVVTSLRALQKIANTRRGSVAGLVIYLFEAGAKVAVFVTTKRHGQVLRLKVGRDTSNPAEPYTLTAVADQADYDVAIRRTGEQVEVRRLTDTDWTTITPVRDVVFTVNTSLDVQILDSLEAEGRSAPWKKFASLSATRLGITRSMGSSSDRLSRSTSRTR